MFYLFILESIGTSELILIGLIALIVLGPRKLPQMARTIGKTMAELRRSTNDFKATWEREVNFDEEKRDITGLEMLSQHNSLAIEKVEAESQNIEGNKVIVPEIREITHEDFSGNLIKEKQKVVDERKTEKISAKQDWL